MSHSKYAAIAVAASFLLASTISATNQRRRVAAVSLALRENATPQRFGTLAAGITSPSASSHTRATGSPRRTPPRVAKPTSMRLTALSDEAPTVPPHYLESAKACFDELAQKFILEARVSGKTYTSDEILRHARHLSATCRDFDFDAWAKDSPEAFNILRDKFNSQLASAYGAWMTENAAAARRAPSSSSHHSNVLA